MWQGLELELCSTNERTTCPAAPFEFRNAAVRSAAVQAPPEVGIPAPPEEPLVLVEVPVVEVVLVVEVAVGVLVLAVVAGVLVDADMPAPPDEACLWDRLAVLEPPQAARARASPAVARTVEPRVLILVIGRGFAVEGVRSCRDIR